MSKNRIEVGDNVHVTFSDVSSLNKAEVLNIPCSTGDSWILREVENKRLWYVQQFECMMLDDSLTPKENKT